MKERFCNEGKPVGISQISHISKTHSGAESRFVSMQGRPELAEDAEGQPCQRNNKAGIPLLGSSGECRPCTPTSSKYNGRLFDKEEFKFIVGIDYFTLNLIGKIPIEADEAEVLDRNFRFVDTEKPTKLAYPREGNQLKRYTIRLHIENQNFYDETDLQSILEEFLFQFPVKFNNITRVDVYLDSYGFQNGINLNDLDYLLDSGEIITDTLVKDKSKYSAKVLNRSVTTGFSWGSRKTGRYLRIYNKTLELQKGSKEWISKHHELNGLIGHDVFRFEYELKNDFLKHIKQFEWIDIFSPEGQFELLDIARKGHFSFVENGQARNDRKKPFVLFDWDSLRESPKFIYDHSWKRKLPLGHSMRSIQIMVSSLLKHYVINQQPESTLRQIKQILDTYRLRDWFEKRRDEYLKRFLILRVHNYQLE